MNHKLFRLVCSAVALMGTSAYAQTKMNNSNAQKACPSSIQMDEGLSNQYSPAFNAPAAIGIDNGWDIYVRGSFIYWDVSQQYMEVARSVQYAGQAAGVVATPFPDANAVIANPSSQYEPGFKVAVGYDANYDGWSTEVEYTWLHQTTNSTFGSVPTSLLIGQRVWIPNNWFNALSATTQFLASQVTTQWKMNLDMVDWTAGRPFYTGRKMSLSPHVGVRGLWIRQLYTISAVDVLNLAWQPVTSVNRSQTWSVGPTINMEGHAMLDYGVRVEGMFGFSLLYTRYTKLQHLENDQQTLTIVTPIPGNANSYGCLRPTLDTGLGFGWGMYFYDRTYHVDFSARYDFMLLWDQNAMRETVVALGNSKVGGAGPSGDLYLHGLTVNARFDF